MALLGRVVPKAGLAELGGESFTAVEPGGILGRVEPDGLRIGPAARNIERPPLVWERDVALRQSGRFAAGPDPASAVDSKSRSG